MYLIQSLNDLEWSRPESFELENDFIPFELWAVAVEMCYAEFAWNCEKEPLFEYTSPHCPAFNKRYLNQSCNDVIRACPASLEINCYIIV